MKALKSQLTKDILKSGIKIPLKNGATFKFNNKVYQVTKVSKA